MEKLFQAFSRPGFDLKNRIVMAPMTRRRAENDALAPDEMTALYYEQRSSAGLLITEGSQVSPIGYGYTFTPGIYSRPQVDGWKKVTSAVHKKGGKIVLQLWHVGPYSHPLLQPGGTLPVSASAIKPDGQVLTHEGHKDYIASRSLTEEEIFQTADDFGKAAANAKEAGFDGVEIHGAHGYLVDQFIRDGTNMRKDDFGGSIENRARFLFLVLENVINNWSAEHVGIRLSPSFERPGAGESQQEKTFGYIIERLNDYKLSFLHLSEMISEEVRSEVPDKSILPIYRPLYNGALISCGGYSRKSAIRTIDNGLADLIAFGKLFVSNPDLAERLKNERPFNKMDKSTFYHGGSKGYVDYPFLDD